MDITNVVFLFWDCEAKLVRILQWLKNELSVQQHTLECQFLVYILYNFIKPHGLSYIFQFTSAFLTKKAIQQAYYSIRCQYQDKWPQNIVLPSTIHVHLFENVFTCSRMFQKLHTPLLKLTDNFFIADVGHVCRFVSVNCR